MYTHLGVLDDTLEPIDGDAVFTRKSLISAMHTRRQLTSHVFFSRVTILLFSPASSANIVEKLFKSRHFYTSAELRNVSLTSANFM